MVDYKKLKQKALKVGGAIKKGYGETVRFTQEYAPKAEKAFGNVATQIQGSFKPTKFPGVKIDYSTKKLMAKKPLYTMPKTQKIKIDLGTPKAYKNKKINFSNLSVGNPNLKRKKRMKYIRVSSGLRKTNVNNQSAFVPHPRPNIG